VPLTYMQFIDGHAYAFGHLPGSYIADAAISLAACVILAVLLRMRGAKAAAIRTVVISTGAAE